MPPGGGVLDASGIVLRSCSHRQMGLLRKEAFQARHHQAWRVVRLRWCVRYVAPGPLSGVCLPRALRHLPHPRVDHLRLMATRLPSQLRPPRSRGHGQVDLLQSTEPGLYQQTRRSATSNRQSGVAAERAVERRGGGSVSCPNSALPHSDPQLRTSKTVLDSWVWLGG